MTLQWHYKPNKDFLLQNKSLFSKNLQMYCKCWWQALDVVFGVSKEIAWYTRVEIIDFSSQLVVSGSQRITFEKKKNPARIWVWSAIKIPQESFRTIPHCAFSSDLFHKHWADNSNLHRPSEFCRRDKMLTTKFLQTLTVSDCISFHYRRACSFQNLVWTPE